MLSQCGHAHTSRASSSCTGSSAVIVEVDASEVGTLFWPAPTSANGVVVIGKGSG